MGVSIAWTTPRKANWGEDYAISLDLESDSSLSNCKVSVFEDDKVIAPAPYAIGSIQANRRESLDLYTRNKHWKFYTTHIGWPCHQTEKTFSYFIRFKASHPHGKEFSNRDPVTGNHEVQVVVSPEKLREAHGAFGSFVLEVTLESLATGATAIVFPPAAIAIVGIAAILHRPIREICLEGVKDPPEFDENYREIDEPKTPQVGDYNISPSDAEKPFGQLAISLAQLYPQLRSFYTTERRIYTANNLRDFEIRRLQTRHIESLERTLSARLDAVIRSELEVAREVPTDIISPTEHLFDVVDKWTAKQQTESGEDHMEVRSVISEAFAEVLGQGISYQELMIAALGHFREIRTALRIRTTNAMSLNSTRNESEESENRRGQTRIPGPGRTFFDSILAKDPLPLTRLAFALNSTHQHREAEEICNIVIHQYRSNVDAYLSRGYARSNLGRYLEALEDFDKALTLVGPSEPRKLAQIYYNRGYTKMLLGRLSEAREDALRGLALNPNERGLNRLLDRLDKSSRPAG